MATIITHPIIPVVAAYLISKDKIPPRLLFVSCIASIIPDLDVIGLGFGIPYGDQYGHRGFSHSIFFAGVTALIAMMFGGYFKTSKNIIFSMIFIGAVSHGLLDAMTDGGRGVAFFWPFSAERYFLPIQPIEVSPIGIRSFLTPRGATVLWSELWLIWLPALAIIFWRIRKNKLQNK